MVNIFCGEATVSSYKYKVPTTTAVIKYILRNVHECSAFITFILTSDLFNPKIDQNKEVKNI